MQFQVPQNIDLEDKIIGPLTLIQFLYCIGGGVIVYLLFMTLTWKNFFFWLLAVPIGLVALSMAFLKIQDQPLSHFIKAGLVYLSKPRIHIWRRQGIAPQVLIKPPETKVETPIAPKRQIVKSELEQLAQQLDTQRVSAENLDGRR